MRKSLCWQQVTTVGRILSGEANRSAFICESSCLLPAKFGKTASQAVAKLAKTFGELRSAETLGEFGYRKAPASAG